MSPRLYPVAGLLIGVVGTYLFAALVGWDLHPGNWSTWWRLLTATFAVFWGSLGVLIGVIARDTQ